MEKEDSNHAGRGGIRLSVLMSVMVAIISALAVTLLMSAFGNVTAHEHLQEATEQYIVSQRDASDMMNGSDYLTEQVRMFTISGELSYAENFFKEVNQTRRREKALESIRDYFMDSESYGYLEAAMLSSTELEKLERYALRLAAEGYGIAPDTLPQELQGIALEADDLSLSPDMQIRNAQLMVFSDEYLSEKETISQNVKGCMEALTQSTRDGQIASNANAIRFMRWQTIITLFMLLALAALAVLSVLLIFRPIRHYVALIHKGKTLPENGVYELRFLAGAYNESVKRSEQQKQRLAYDATHDPLTGLLNRAVFEKLRSRCTRPDNAMLIIDVDRFKTINDRCGHDAGDRALIKVSQLLQSHFRAEDYVCRIGGDEFAIVMVYSNSTMRDVVKAKIDAINRELGEGNDDLPPFSLSVGVAFGDRENPSDDIFKDADAMTYRVKSSGGCGCAFY